MKISKFLLILLCAATMTGCMEKASEEPNENKLFKENAEGFDQLLNNTQNIQLKTEYDTVSYLLGFVNSGSSADLRKSLSKEGCDSAQTDLLLQGIADAIKYGRSNDANAYTSGLQIGLQLLKHINSIENHIYGFKQSDHLSPEIVLAGCLDSYNNRSKIKGMGDDRNTMSNVLFGKLKEIDQKYKQTAYQEYKQKNLDFMEKKIQEEGIRKLKDGVCYQVIKTGKGPLAQLGQQVEIKYTGQLIDGTTFDSTDAQGEPLKVQLGTGTLIPGFDQALQHMPMGSVWKVYIPAEEAYQDNRSGKIPPYSTLIFNIETLQILE